MPKFTIEDVDKRIDEIRERHRLPKPTEGGKSPVIQGLLDKAKKRKRPGEVRPPV